MSIVHSLHWKKRATALLALCVIIGSVLSALPVMATPTGTSFDHIVILAMENQDYSSVLGDGTSSGCPSGTAPFLCSMLPYSSTIPNYHSYCSSSSTDPACSLAGTLGNPPCSAACYTTVTSGNTYGVSDGVGAGSVNQTSIFDSLTATGLGWKEFCESGCPRGPDHSPCLQYANTYQSADCITLSSGLVGNSQVLSTFNSSSPPNYIWLTPTDSHNMHDNPISSGDSWVKSLLVGTGSITSPASGSLLATSLFTSPSYHTLLWIWWDEYDPSPNIEYGPMIKQGFISTSNAWDEYSQLKMVENNWGFSDLSYALSAPLLSDILGSTGPLPLTTSFINTPLIPHVNTSVTFTAATTGGTPQYTYRWNFGDGSVGTGAVVSHSYKTAGTFNANETVTDSASHTSSFTLAIVVFPTSSPPAFPHMTGWAGARIDEAAANPSNPPSQVFAGENASDLEMLMQRLKSLGYGVLRIQWTGTCGQNSGDGPYSSTNLQRAMQLAQHYGLWIAPGVGSDTDMTSANETCWLNQWSPIISQFKNGYNGFNNFVWGPENEPTGLSMTQLSASYQAFIDQARSLGDKHWITVENLCDFSCPFSGSNMVQGFPTVNDTQSQVLISFHSYYGWKYNSGNWNNVSADAEAQIEYQVVVQGSSLTGWPVFVTEGGADPQVSACAGPPDCVLPGSSGYTTVTFSFIQTLTNLYNAANIDWMWYPAASWTDTPCAGLYGALSTAVCASGANYSGGPAWGTLLSHAPDFSLSASPSSVSAGIGAQTTSTIGLNLINGFSSPVTLSLTVPHGLSASLGTSTITGSQTSLLTILSSTAGSYSIVVQGTSGSLTRTMTIPVIIGTQSMLVLSAPSTESVVQTRSLTFTVSATDSAVSTPTLTLSASQVPTDATFQQTQGTSPISSNFTWTPTASDSPGTYAVSFTVNDGTLSAQTYVVITVVSSNVLPIISMPGRMNATVGKALTFTVSATDPSGLGGAVTLSSIGLVSDMSFNQSTGLFSFMPTSGQAGQTFVISFFATDSNNPMWNNTRSMPIYVQPIASQTPGGGLCLSCLLPNGLATMAWLLVMGALVGIVSTIGLLHLRASLQLKASRRRIQYLNEQRPVRHKSVLQDNSRRAIQRKRESESESAGNE